MRSKFFVAETSVPEHTRKNMFGHDIWTARMSWVKSVC